MGYVVLALAIAEILIRFITSSATNTSMLEWVSIPIWEKWLIGWSEILKEEKT